MMILSRATTTNRTATAATFRTAASVFAGTPSFQVVVREKSDGHQQHRPSSSQLVVRSLVSTTTTKSSATHVPPATVSAFRTTTTAFVATPADKFGIITNNSVTGIRRNSWLRSCSRSFAASSSACPPKLLTDEERAVALSELASINPTLTQHGWEEVAADGSSGASTAGPTAINKTFLFRDFSQAWGFMSRCALLAEQMDHHPEWSNVYNVVEVKLSTHSCQGLSQNDVDMAAHMDRYAAELLASNERNKE